MEPIGVVTVYDVGLDGVGAAMAMHGVCVATKKLARDNIREYALCTLHVGYSLIAVSTQKLGQQRCYKSIRMHGATWAHNTTLNALCQV